jgi:hypothetical protein
MTMLPFLFMAPVAAELVKMYLRHTAKQGAPVLS